jgi:uncharacterized protein involved in exopolysaccharide biosynthesis
MNKLSAILRFLYRIRYWIILIPLSVTILVTYFTGNMQKTYEASTTIFTGITSSPSINGVNADYLITNNSFDNIINLVHSRSTLEKVSLKLFAQDMINGSPKTDNVYITASNYIKLQNIVPDDVKKLIDTSSIEKTYENLVSYKKENSENFIYGLLNWVHPHYSISSLNKIQVNRLGSSDMIEIKYSCDDPGIVHQTLLILNDIISTEYSELQLSPSNDVIEYFEKQLKLNRQLLSDQEDSLLKYSLGTNIINFEEQTKNITLSKQEIDDKYEQAYTDFYTSRYLIISLEKQLKERTALMKENKKFIQTLENVSNLSKKITEIETFSDESSGSRISVIPKYKEMLNKSESDLYNITANISSIEMSKEGVALESLVQNWLTQILLNEKSKAELEVYKKRRQQLDDEFSRYTPIGPNLKRLEREISVTENSYQTSLNHLAQARLQQKDIQMRSSTLRVVSAPVYPLVAHGSKRKLLILAAFFGSFFFILFCFLIVELLDKTIRDKNRAQYLTKTKVWGAFPGVPTLKHRGFALEDSRRATAYVCNRLLQNIPSSGTKIINILSSEPHEGKTYIANNMKEYMEGLGFAVRYISHDKDFDILSREYLISPDHETLCPPESNTKYDIVLIEYPPLLQGFISGKLLKSGNVNMYITKATRAWREIDQTLLDQIKALDEKIETLIFLNFAERVAVEEFTGQLPPYTKFRNWSYRMLQMELTSERRLNFNK